MLVKATLDPRAGLSGEGSDLKAKVLAIIDGSVFLLGAAHRLVRVVFFSTSALIDSYQTDDEMIKLRVHTFLFLRVPSRKTDAI